MSHTFMKIIMRIRWLSSSLMQNLSVSVIYVIGISILAGQLSANRQGALPPDLFESTNLPDRELSLPAHVMSYEPVLVDIDLLASLVIGSKITLNIFPDASYVGIVKQVRYHSKGSFTISGYLPSDPGSGFTIAVVHDVAAGSIHTSIPTNTFQLRYIGDGVHIIGEIDGSLYPPDGKPRVTENTEESEPPSETFEKSPAFPACVPEPVFDLLILYTPAARSAAGGTNSILALTLLAVQETNEAYENSLIPSEVRLVHCQEVSYSEAGNTYDDHLDFVTNDADIASLRTYYGADLVSMWVDDDTYCGMGWCYNGGPEKGFSTIHWDCATGNYSQAHEMGHNQGCAHDRDNADGCNLYSYSYGWRFIGDDSYEYRTVMSYRPGIRIQYFSNPNVQYNGQATGVPIGDPEEAENAETIRSTASIVRAFRPSKYGVWVDFANTTSPWEGTFTNPYLTVGQGLAALVYGNNASELPTMWIKSGSSIETPTFNNPLVVRSCGGSAIIGE